MIRSARPADCKPLRDQAAMTQKVSCLTCKCGRLMSVFQKSKTKHGGFETAEAYVCRDRHWWNYRQHTPPILMLARIPSRSRDHDFSQPPPRIRTGGFPASGSCLR